MNWHRPQEAAVLIGLSVEQIYRLCASKRLSHRRIGLVAGRGKIRISDTAIAEFLESCEVPAIPQEKGAAAPQARSSRPRVISGRPDGKPLSRDWSAPGKRS
jgi:excisionase family DNA binding protein